MSTVLPRVAAAAAQAHVVGNWMEMLRVMHPPRSLVHVGAGAGGDLPVYADWGLRSVMLIDADPTQAKRLAEQAAGQAGWTVRQVLIDQNDGEAQFFVASNWRESGLVPADSLKFIWRNLLARETRALPAVRLDSLFAENAETERPNWLVIDCFPAVRILAGARQLLGTCDVVSVRVALSEPGIPALGLALAEADAVMTELGFSRLAVEEERAVVIGRALFVRNHKALLASALEQLRCETSALRDLKSLDESRVGTIASLEGQIAELRAARETASRSEQAMREQLGALEQASADVAAALGVREAEWAAAQQAHDARTSGLQSDVERLQAECAALAAQCEELRQDRDRLSATIDRISADRAQEEQMRLETGSALDREVKAREMLHADCQALRAQLDAALATAVAEKTNWDIEKAGLIEERAALNDALQDQIRAHSTAVDMYGEELAIKTSLVIELESLCDRGDGHPPNLESSASSGGERGHDARAPGTTFMTTHEGVDPVEPVSGERWRRLESALGRAEAQIELISELLLKPAHASGPGVQTT